MMIMMMKFLFLVAGAVAAPELSPPPLGLLSGEEGGPVRISCFAPRNYAGSTFELFGVGASRPVQSVSAEPGQYKVNFVLDGAALGFRCYRCRYRSYNGSAWQSSHFSTEIMVNASADSSCAPLAVPTGPPWPTATTLRQDRSWLLPVALSAAGLVLLVAVLAVVAQRVKARRQQTKRDQESCWTETRYPTTELSYENCTFAVSLSGSRGAESGRTTAPSPEPPEKRPSRAASPEMPHFSTFKALE
ncbi:protein HIDE1 isoform X3 [Apteryx rowi]|uniref:protein HIDE1 isoform X3 n=1 Tax=Apteryx rowi TaxID=308060 RepID=UPI000E1D5B17|nr:protein HIDE1 isoform X3 [Apteryx rowi]